MESGRRKINSKYRGERDVEHFNLTLISYIGEGKA